MSEIERINDVPMIPARRPDGHKGTFGHVLIIGGSQGMIGAVALAARAALRGGAGLVTFAAPRTVQQTIASLVPCATSVPLSCDESGRIDARAVREALDAAAVCDVLAVGPGMGQGLHQQNLVRAILEQDKPVVLDADGLNNLDKIDDWAAARRCPLVLTPHPGEFARLTDKSVAKVQADRMASAIDAARFWMDVRALQAPPLALVLKGAGTVVTDGRRVYVNPSGNPGMATGGTGDVLTGLIAALIGQGVPLFDAACLGANVHGVAGDLAANQLGQVSLIASDLLDYLPAALKQVS